jgi:hypothetical protein
MRQGVLMDFFEVAVSVITMNRERSFSDRRTESKNLRFVHAPFCAFCASCGHSNFYFEYTYHIQKSSKTGSALVEGKALKEKNWPAITARAQAFVRAVAAAGSGKAEA